nr:MAG TPA: hypothetical protein [Caudoviricetes sp.]DAU41744.1 MAG TPA: hypothetical protein [Caudoviricetes sp.]
MSGPKPLKNKQVLGKPGRALRLEGGYVSAMDKEIYQELRASYKSEREITSQTQVGKYAPKGKRV